MDRVDNLLWDIHNATLDELDSKNDLGHAGDLLAVRRNLVHQFPNVINDDSFLALTVRERGFKVKRLNHGSVWITGPKSPTDYIYQRSRILRGHFELIRRFGKIPTTFEFNVIKKPRRSIRLMVTTIASHGPSSLFPIFVAGLLEFVSLNCATFSSLFEPTSRPWLLVESTKRFQSQ